MALISAETGTLAFAVINLVLVIGSLFLGIGILIFWGFGFLFLSFGIGVLVNLSLLFVPIISLVFSSFLMNGILKKIPEHIKAYYIFGIFNIVLGLCVLIAMCSAGADVEIYVYVIALFIYIIYALILSMIRYTYTKIETNRKQYGHQHLDEKC